MATDTETVTETTLGGQPKAAVAVAASAGGVEALTAFVRRLPPDFPGVVLVVLHLPDTGPSVLPSILARVCALTVVRPEEREALRAGLVVVAPPGQHLRVRAGFAALDRGPRENGHRPSADALMRSVAETFGRRAAGVVLSGTMDDGAAGLQAICVAGGLALVQDPNEAGFPGMPRAAIAQVHQSTVRRVDDMVPELVVWIDTLDDAEIATSGTVGTSVAAGRARSGVDGRQSTGEDHGTDTTA